MSEQEYAELLRLFGAITIGGVLLSLFGLVVIAMLQALKGGGDE